MGVLDTRAALTARGIALRWVQDTIGDASPPTAMRRLTGI